MHVHNSHLLLDRVAPNISPEKPQSSSDVGWAASTLKPLMALREILVGGGQLIHICECFPIQAHTSQNRIV